MLHGGERGRFVNRHCASFRIGTIGTPYHGRANLARVCYIRKRDDFRIYAELGGWQHWRFTASCGGEQFHLMQIIRDFSGAACVSSEREQSLNRSCRQCGDMGSVCRLKPPLDLLHGVYQIGLRSRTIGARKSGHFADCPIMFDLYRFRPIGFPQESEIPTNSIPSPGMPSTSTIQKNEIWLRASELTDLIHKRESLENEERHKRQQIMELLLKKKTDKEETPYGTIIIATRNEYKYPVEFERKKKALDALRKYHQDSGDVTIKKSSTYLLFKRS